ncbi:MAG: Fis family transcriptional regulator [Proteobacteria bacterium]|nr:MAG: Fis family transcriptional regulator [Pseudomonadota bacterium]
MERHAAVLLDVWRECGRHIEIEDSLARAAALLGERLPFEWIVVRRLDAARGVVETAATAGRRPGAPAFAPRTALDPPELETLVAWARGGRVVHERARALAERLPGVVPDGAERDLLAGPLGGESGPTGVLLLVARRGARFEKGHAALAQALLDPFTAALENDRRLRSLVTREAAADADRRSLLSRLGRSDLQETIVGAEAGFRPVMERAHLVAPSDVPVLVLGETGSGKEVVARAIHLRSPRAAGPFLRVNCGAIPHGLIDSELFGHERGSFTGAEGQRKGWFERADGGTLFLDEIGELPLPAQVRLLRILQDGSFERVGGQRPLHVDVRIVAATHRDLRAMVADGRFREDLWYRLAVFPIQLPPLRERPEDIPALATHFALRAATRFGTPPRVPSPEEMELLLAYPWPGNVRELAAVIERAVILGNGRTLEVATSLGTGLHAPAAPPRGARADGEPDAAALLRAAPQARAGGAFLSLDDAVRRHIEEALLETRGRIEGPRGAAALLRVNPHTLRAKMRRLRLDWQRFRPDADR